ncbi:MULTISPECIES: pirin family protein [unclassified Dietzia]|uniref:pirin family protein n=1 Tax=unclassified Dietzia TaxID=2617939 RepID=UPI002118C085|nr:MULTISPECIES: pirin family protein [unclassified Dietzia]MDV3353983.1 pirin family protein [Dietzia sp. IN118]
MSDIRIHRSRSRSHDAGGWLDSRHSFSFGNYQDPMNTHFGRLLVNNDDRIAAGSGFDTHGHRDMEIVTWVLSGSLVHQDSEGHSGIIYPGLAQRMSAGSGILHSERNDGWRDGPVRPEAAPADPVHLVQMWVVPDSSGGDPGYEQLEIEPAELENQLVVVAGGLPTHADRAAIRIRDRSSALHAARLAPGRSVQLPDAPYVHLYVPLGSVTLEGEGLLDTGDAARMTAAGGRRVTAGDHGAEILAWEMHAGMTMLDVRGH